MRKNIIIILFIISFAIPSVSFSNPSPNIPTSSRAKKAMANVTPVLKKELAEAGLKYGAPIFIRIFKEENELEVWVKKSKRYKLFKIYHICTYGPGGLGPKTKQGDGQAPEGFYYVKPNQLNPVSQFHLSFNLGYPNKYDRIHKRTGAALMVHGNCVSIGCYAMTDKIIEQIYTLAYTALINGQKFFRVHIFPFKMTDKNMLNHKNSNWYLFWQNLKQGYDLFEEQGHIPPNVEVENGRYVF